MTASHSTTLPPRQLPAAPTVGHVPPHASELERAILGAMLLEKAAPRLVLSILKTETAFYSRPHQLIFLAIRTLFEAGEAIDQLTVVMRLSQDGVLQRVGGPHYVAELTLRVNSAAHLESHCRFVQELHVKRGIIDAGLYLAQHGYDPAEDALDLLATAQVQLTQLHNGLESQAATSAAALYDAVFAKLAADSGKGGMTGIPTPVRELNRATGGWQPSDLIIIAARPGMGKTAVLLACVRTAALDHGKACAIFSLEMPPVQLMVRLLAAEVQGYSNAQLRRGEVRGADHPAQLAEVQRLHGEARRLASDKIFFDGTAGISIQQLRAKAARLVAEQQVELIFVDYLQLMQGSAKSRGGNREQEISSITRGLKELAKELNVPVIALSQLSRSVESRGGEKRPQLSDLRESGSIEQDADMVAFLYRPEYYGLTQDADGYSTCGLLEIHIAKQRNGKLGPIKAHIDLDRGLLSEWDDEQPAAEEVGHVGPARIGSTGTTAGSLPASRFENDDDNDLPF